MMTTKEKTDSILNKFVEEISEAVEKEFNHNLKVRPAAYGLLMKDNHPTLALLEGMEQLFQMDRGNEAVSKILEKLGEEMKLIAIAFVFEGYYLEKDKDSLDELVDEKGNYKEGAKRPSEDPNSKEVVFINFETYDKQGVMIYMIKRPIDNEPHLVKHLDRPLVPKDKVIAQGKFSNLMKKNHDEMVSSIETMLKNNMN